MQRDNDFGDFGAFSGSISNQPEPIPHENEETKLNAKNPNNDPFKILDEDNDPH